MAARAAVVGEAVRMLAVARAVTPATAVAMMFCGWVGSWSGSSARVAMALTQAEQPGRPTSQPAFWKISMRVGEFS